MHTKGTDTATAWPAIVVPAEMPSWKGWWRSCSRKLRCANTAASTPTNTKGGHHNANAPQRPGQFDQALAAGRERRPEFGGWRLRNLGRDLGDPVHEPGIAGADDALGGEQPPQALVWTRRHANQLRVDEHRIAALGWSAGAHLAASAAVFGADKGQRPDLLALVSPAVSIVNDGHFRALFPPGMSMADFSPAQQVRPGLLPTIIVTGRADTVTPLAEVSKFHEQMLKAGNVSVLMVYDEVGHLFTLAGERDDGFPKPNQAVQRQAYEAIDTFLIAHGYRTP
jgi:dienelactone hydrolase